MTNRLDDIIETSFYLSYYLGLQTSEIDNLTTYEVRSYINLLNPLLENESKKDSSILGALGSLFGGKKSSGKGGARRK